MTAARQTRPRTVYRMGDQRSRPAGRTQAPGGANCGTRPPAGRFAPASIGNPGDNSVDRPRPGPVHSTHPVPMGPMIRSLLSRVARTAGVALLPAVVLCCAGRADADCGDYVRIL